jgi:multiple sugar transport system permease protein
MTKKEWNNVFLGLLFISPWIVGFLVFLVYPIVSSAYMSLTEFSGFGDMSFIGTNNYQQMFNDSLFWASLYNTLYYTILAVPLGAIIAIILALAMNQKLVEIPIYRAALYLPSVLPVYAVSFIFIWLLNPRYGLVNLAMSAVGLPSINWFGDPAWAKLAIVMLAQLGAGQYALIFLAGLRGIPQTLYDAAEIDGASSLRKFWHITLPLLTPVILYDLIVGLGLGLQVFEQAYITTNGGPVDSTLFYVFYLYNNAFRYGQMGYAAAMSWFLFIISLLLALLVFWSSKRWVNYEVVA